MSQSLFAAYAGLDTDYLDTLYGDQPEAAVEMFEMYLRETPADVAALKELFSAGAVVPFAKQLHKVRAGFSYVGLTDITATVAALEEECKHLSTLESLRDKFQSLIDRIQSSAVILQGVLQQLHARAALA